MDGSPQRRSALVLYGSETGNALDYAHELGCMIERLHFWASVSHLDAVEPLALNEYTIVVILISTTGQGDLPVNAQRFWKSLLRRKLPADLLQNTQFSTFGLGDSSYPKYNWAARKIHKRLVQLGANELYPRGEADEQHEEGLDASFVPWSTDLRRLLLETFPLEPGLEPIPEETLLEPKWILELAEKDGSHLNRSLPDHAGRETFGVNNSCLSNSATSADDLSNGETARCANGGDGMLKVILQENSRVTSADHWQDVRSLFFSSLLPIAYEPGDVLTIYPHNPKDDVDQLLTAMHWESVADKPLNLVPTSSNPEIRLNQPPPISFDSSALPMTLRKLLSRYLDLNAIPKRSFFSLVAHFTSNEMHKERLIEFTKPEYIDELYDYTTRPRRSILEVLQEFESIKIPWQRVVDVLPELRGRQFSIASGGALKSNAQGNARFELLVAIVKYKTVIKKIRQGVCTRYLATLLPGSELFVKLQKGSLGITQAQAKRPIIMVGPGTGIAPIRSLILERLQWATKVQTDGDDVDDVDHQEGVIAEMVLFFGCRKKDADYFYRNEWEHLQQKMPLKVIPAFSRDQTNKIYVQDLIKEQSELVYRLLHGGGGIVYVCGSSGKMPQSVRIALTEVFKRHGNMHQGDAEAFLQAIEKEGRYKQETW
ncbi:MAG: hypothetical protein Q9191_001477 [Dirinaria sp. TL-2023a]